MADRQMFSDEVVTLMAIKELDRPTEKQTGHPKDITDDHIGYLCDSLVRRGYISVNNPGGYQLTSKGRNTVLREAILLVACGDEAWSKDGMERLEWLYAEISQRIQ